MGRQWAYVWAECKGEATTVPCVIPLHLPPMTAQQINHIAKLASERAHAASRAGGDTLEAWEAIVRLKLLACSVAQREIEATGYSWAYAPLP